MRASRQRRPTRSGRVVLALFGALVVSPLAISCGGSTPMDMWITKDPDAGADFDAPMREVGFDTRADVDTGGTGGDGGNTGAGGTAGDTGSAGTTGGQGGQGGQAGDTGGAGAGGTGGNS
jgi:hypothetical protein